MSLNALREPSAPLDPEALIRELGLIPHPEGGHYLETHRSPSAQGERGALTCIYFLLRAGERSHWHHVDAEEVWLHHAGAPLALSTSAEPGVIETVRLGANFAAGERPQVIVPRGVWQAAESLGAFTLVSCVVAPAFQFEGFTLAPPGFQP